jgi:uncharacterized membrane protein (UPF0136 family)
MHFAQTLILIYAALLVVGGLIGWRVGGSRMSLTMSLLSAALLAVGYRISLSEPKAGLLMAAVVAFALTMLFVFRLRKTHKFMPSGMMLVLSAIVGIYLAWTASQIG